MNINEFWKAVLAQDAEKIKLFFNPNAYVNWYCTNEHFTVDEFIRANCDCPGNWDGKIEKVLTADDTIVTVSRVYPKDKYASYHVTSFI